MRDPHGAASIAAIRRPARVRHPTVREAIRAHGACVVEVAIAGDHPLLDAGRFARPGIEVKVVARSELDRRARGARTRCHGARSGCASRRWPSRAGPGTLLVALDGIEDPQNFGAILRSAVALGATGVLWAEHSSAPLSPATFRASAGAVEHAVLARVSSLPSALQHLATQGAPAVGLDAQGDVDLAEVDLTGPVVFVIGSEGKGLMKSVRRACARLARLPMGGAIGSLNASVAAAIALYEARRQRGGHR
jgi:23S rRNA (guanosine2251-2'-O)-methyltransferase